MKIVLVTGGFDPIHSGHINYLNSAKKLGDKLIVGLNSDAWLTRKKGKPFMPMNERLTIMNQLKMVDQVVFFGDYYDLDNSASKFIKETLELYPTDEIIFANGGDRTVENIPEMEINDSRLSFAFGVGGEDKQNSSSWILQEWKSPKIHRVWGNYRVLYDEPGTKVKELIVKPNSSLSLQKHFNRAEYWHIVSGKCYVELNGVEQSLEKHDTITIDVESLHKLSNPFSEECRLIEVQYGTSCDEEDILRL